MMPFANDFGLRELIDKGHVRKARSLLDGPNGRAAAVAHGGGPRPTALFYLFDAKRVALLPHLLAAGADLEARNQDEETPLMQFLRRTVRTEEDWVRAPRLIDAGAGVNAHRTSPHSKAAGETGPLAFAVMTQASCDILKGFGSLKNGSGFPRRSTPS